MEKETWIDGMMMKGKVYVAGDNVVSSLGFTSEENFAHLKKMETGVKRYNDASLWMEPLMASRVDDVRLEREFAKLGSSAGFTRLEKMMLVSATAALSENKKIDISSSRTLIIVSSTKGNIELLDKEEGKRFEKKRLYLWETAAQVARFMGNPNKPLVVSNACISGVLAIILAKRLLDEGKYDTMVVIGADSLTKFVVSGFQSFKAVSNEVAKPYDAKRAGISLGEGCGTMVLTNDETKLNDAERILVMGGASSNDANHISGPSRTGDGLQMAIEKTLSEAMISAEEVDYISGHGTATQFNDDMESLAVANTQLGAVPMNSLKSYFGHTLGAAGIIESVMGVHSMRQNTLIGTYNFEELGVPATVNIIKDTRAEEVNNCLKTAAGFGGCNAAVLFEKLTSRARA
ncbi:MAG: beta-ketoacyl synthase N-terminal-like domain-containing protein [Bacteroidota bacterium]